MSERSERIDVTAPERSTTRDTDLRAAGGSPVGLALAGVAVVVALAALSRFLEQTVPAAAKGTAFAGVAAAIEFPVYAILLGLLGNVVLTRLGLRDRLAGGFRTEFFIKTGLVLLGASINFAVILTAAGPAILQALVLISVVFGFTWWLGGRLGLDDRLRALLSSAVSICGISAAIAAAGAVQAKREQLAYTASLVVVFALPSIFLLPAAAHGLGLSQPVAGAWIGGNIDTTAAVSAAGALAGEQALQLATIVKTTQNALLGVVAVALTAYFAVRVERSTTSAASTTWPAVGRPAVGALPEVRARFPGRLRDRDALRRVGRVGRSEAGDRDRERPADAVPDPRVRLDRAGVPRRAAARGGLATGRCVRQCHGGQPGRRPPAGDPAVPRLPRRVRIA